MNIDGVSILARGITAEGPEGAVFENVDLAIGSGSLTVLTGTAGSGRTSMLLALSGRLELVAGYLEVSGYLLPRYAATVREFVVPARLHRAFDLEPRMSVRQTAAERRMIAGVSAAAIDDAFALVEIDPDPTALVGDLHPADRLLLALALAAAQEPRGLLVDDVEDGLSTDDRARVWSALRTLTDTGMTVIASSTDPVDDAADIWLPYYISPFDLRTGDLR